ncbi:MAG: lipocalin family protein [Bacteroidaceae bacterium]|nr:lipocalin family protein [Bacteroidaceae bacterium]
MEKKNLWRLLTVMLVAMLSFGFASCGDDDDDDNNGGGNVTVEKLAGLWELCHVKGTALDENDQRIKFDRDVTTSAEDLAWLEYADFVDFVRYEFGKDNTFKSYYIPSGGGDWKQSVLTTYIIEGQTVIVDYGRYEERVTVTRLTDTELVIHVSDSEDGYDVYATFKRIK